ncbi:MAG: substrate-binding domain-containing protein [Verrucomicrobia bacterium]|nr:substrate-binding domain-containing protein [Verrucomicrobiota bacterium]MCH8528688.1 substrate-binding domain-containing protein [Kiritimatiellia bacterium]
MTRPSDQPQPVTVGIDLDLKLGFHAQIAKGMMRFRNTRPHWSFLETRPGQLSKVPFPLAGMIGHFIDPVSDQAAFEAKGIPHAVSITNHQPGPFPWSQVINDDPAIGRMAAEYFLRKRFRHFAVWGLQDLNFSNERIEGFRETLQQKTIDTLHEYDQSDRNRLEHLRQHLPLALFAVSDATAKSLMGYLGPKGLRIPHDIALLGVDNDPHVDLYTTLPLSSIEPDGERIGFEACRLLERKLQNAPSGPEILRIPPVGIQDRLSTETRAVDDARVRKIQAYMDRHLADIQDMEQVARALHMHRRHLDRCFIAALGVTPADWLARRRVHRAEQLLQETDDTIDLIAARVGLQSRRRLNLTFQKFHRPLPSTQRK